MGFKSVPCALCSRVLFLLVGSLGFYQQELQAAKVVVPSASAPVIDDANALSPSSTSQLNQILTRVYAQSGVQLGVLVTKSLGGLPIEDYSIQVATEWKLGTDKTDKGALLIVAPNERRVRIEVGYGLEGELTDLQSGRIINNVMIPYFKQGNWNDGVLAGVGAILQQVAPQALSDLQMVAPSQPPRNKPVGRGVSVFVAFILFMLFVRVLGGGGKGGGRGGGHGSAFLLGALLGSTRRSSGFGGGGSSWGSWGGGGGGFGGGGASGSW